MTTLNMQQHQYIGQSPSPTTSVCQERTNLLDRLAGLLVDLGNAKVEFRSSVLTGNSDECESARYQVEKLRDACSTIRLDLESHRAEHGC